MEQQTRKKIIEFLHSNWKEKRSSIASLVEIGEKVGNVEITAETIWSRMKAIDELVRSTEQDSQFKLFEVEKFVLSLLDTNLVRNITKRIEEIEKFFNKLGDGIPGSRATLEKSKLEKLGLSEKTIKQWADQFSQLQPHDQKTVLHLLSEMHSLTDSLQAESQLLSAALGTVPGVISTFELGECVALLKGSKSYDVPRMIRTLIEGMNNENKIELARTITELLSKPAFRDRKMYSWEEVLLLGIFIHVAFSSFTSLPRESQQVLLRHYFYHAIAIQVPVGQILRKFLYETDTIIAYFDRNKFLFDTLNSNNEEIFLTLEEEKKETLRKIFGSYVTNNQKDLNSSKNQEKFVTNLYSKEPHSDLLQVWLQESLLIYCRLKSAILVEKNEGGELTPDEQYANDVILLLAWFGIGSDGAESLINYFKQKHSRVPLPSFIDRLKETADLNDETTVENIVEFTSALHEHNLLDSNNELVEFYQDDSKFHWNDNLSFQSTTPAA